MMRTKAGLLFTVLACSMAYGQGADTKPQFDVASIKPAPLPTGGMIRIGPPSGGPGTKDPTRFTASSMPLFALIMQAYDVKPYQVTGPNWLMSERFDITAKVPEGATKEQFQLMLQNLLEDRFKMVAHREKKDSQVYELVVGKGGHKMKESVVEPPKEGADAGPPPLPPGGLQNVEMGKDGFPVLPAGRGGGRGPMMIMMNGRAKMQANQMTIDQLVTSLGNQLGKPVMDATGLKGKYDFTLYFSPEGLNGPMGRGGMMPPPPPPGGREGGGAGPVIVGGDGEPGPNLFSAVQDQLGLKLEQKKGQVDLIVIDKMEKVPTEN